MEDSGVPATQTPEGLNAASKRKRSTSAERSAYSVPPQKSAKTHSTHLQINYLARLYSDILPLITVDDTLPSLLQLISDYIGVLDRHESMAGNLGAKPLGPILMKRFERLFDGPPRVLKANGKEGTTVTWLDVVEFARHKPEQFNLEKMRDGVRVCQFYTKQSRVEISEEDYVLIASGMPQKLIPPQPIVDDEEKELGTLEILEKNIGQLVTLTDQVAGRARQLKHRIGNRKQAIISRRAEEAESLPISEPGASPSLGQASDQPLSGSGERRESSSPTSGFVAVNSRPSGPSASDGSKSQNMVNGKQSLGSSVSHHTKAELMALFAAVRNESNNLEPDTQKATPTSYRPHSMSKSKARPSSDIADYANILLNSASPVPIPNTPASLAHFPKAQPVDRFDDSGPYKAEMLSRMDSMQRGDRVLPPCDRCRRLHMDCLKNLTACLGCTKKHAKCSWKDVTEQELLDNPHVPRAKAAAADSATGNDGYSPPPVTIDGTPQGVPDEELLGEESDDGKDLVANIPLGQHTPVHSDNEVALRGRGHKSVTAAEAEGAPMARENTNGSVQFTRSSHRHPSNPASERSSETHASTDRDAIKSSSTTNYPVANPQGDEPTPSEPRGSTRELSASSETGYPHDNEALSPKQMEPGIDPMEGVTQRAAVAVMSREPSWGGVAINGDRL